MILELPAPPPPAITKQSAVIAWFGVKLPHL